MQHNVYLVDFKDTVEPGLVLAATILSNQPPIEKNKNISKIALADSTVYIISVLRQQ